MTSRVFHHKKRSTGEAYQVFFDALQSHSLHRLVKTACEFFGVPVLLTNEHYQLICLFPEEEIGVPIYDELFRNRILPKELIASYQQEYLAGTTQFYEPFYANTGQVEDCPRIFGEVYTDERIYGHFAILLSGESLFENDLECARIFRDALQILMVSPRRSDYNSYSSYLINLLEPDTPGDLRLFAVEEIGKITNSGYALMATQIGSSASQHAFATMVTGLLSMNYYEVISAVYGEYLVTLFGSVKGKESYRSSERQFFENRARGLGQAGRSGLSRPFENLQEIPVHYQEAVLARKAGPEDELSIFYEKLPGVLFCKVAEGEESKIFLHPVLARMKEYDRENATHYYDTVRVYSMCLHNKELTADRLHIHRNTLLYRINRIVEEFRLPVDDPETALHLINSFQLLDAMKKG